jgi:hypothetical protein
VHSETPPPPIEPPIQKKPRNLKEKKATKQKEKKTPHAEQLELF